MIPSKIDTQPLQTSTLFSTKENMTRLNATQILFNAKLFFLIKNSNKRNQLANIFITFKSFILNKRGLEHRLTSYQHTNIKQVHISFWTNQKIVTFKINVISVRANGQDHGYGIFGLKYPFTKGKVEKRKTFLSRRTWLFWGVPYLIPRLHLPY